MRLFLNENLTLKEIGSKFEMTASRIQQIIYENKHLIDWDRNYEKAIRINALKRMSKDYESVLGKKSTIDIHEQLRKELEGDKPLLNMVIDKRTFVYLDAKAKEEVETGTNNRIASELSSK